MTTFTTSLRRVVIFSSGVALGLSLLSGVASATPSQDHGNGNTAHSSSNPDNQTAQPASNADYSGSGANQHGAYDSTRDGSASANGNGNGTASGKPCAGCVGKADNKNPKGQAPGGSDHNNGYECDGNHGVGRGNPAHTGCTSTTGSNGGGTSTTGTSGGTHTSPGSDVDATDAGSADGTGTSSTPGTSVAGVSTTAGPLASGTPGTLADKPICAGGLMTSDVNGDGAINSLDCAAVEGLTITKAASTVLGTILTRDPATAGSSNRVVALGAGAVRGITTLASTGIDSIQLTMVALALMALGTVMVRRAAGKRH